jgi:aspartate/methionine/tyrosine aminotransferase
MITLNDLNPRLLHAQYAVRGPIVQRAQEMEAQGHKIIYCNIGNPQALKQQPLTYLRQALSLLENPALLNDASVLATYPRDIVARVRMLLQKHPFGTGAYTQSPGIPFVRQAVADFISKRDGVQADKDHIILTDGASKGVQAVLTALLKTPQDGVMVPIPQYPLYSASLALYGGRQIGYYLDEENKWQLNEQILEASITRAQAEGTRPVAIVVINPGNPTGAVLSRENIAMIVGFARKHGMSIIADEVYQENVYEKGARFQSFTRVMSEMGVTDITLFTLHSVSKGFLGECGHRGGYLELRNLPDDVLGQFVKLQSISLCANVSGQFATYFMVAPPGEGDESYATYVKERDGILAALKRKAEILGEGINRIAGMAVDIPQGSMYAFVRFELPRDRTVDVARLSPEEREQHEARRDSAYCLALLEETGICVVPGSGFGQKAGTFHFRTTFLPPQDEIESLVQRLKTFHEKYVHVLEEA